MKIRLSNSPTSFGFTLDEEAMDFFALFNHRMLAEINEDEHTIILKGDPRGYKISSQTGNPLLGAANWTTRRPSNWPLHGSVELLLEDLKSDRIVLRLPSQLPEPVSREKYTRRGNRAPRVTSQRIVPSTKTPPPAPKKTANVLLECHGREYCFNVPEEEL